MKDFNSPEYKRSRIAYMGQCTAEYFISILVADAFLAKLLTSIGVSDHLIGIISSFASTAFVIQLITIFMVKSNISAKKLVMLCDTLSITFFMLLYFVPFIPVAPATKTILIVVFIVLAYVGKMSVISLLYKWANSYVAPDRRARYSANKEIISLILGMAFTAIVGYVIDRFEGIGNINGGFLFIAIALFILNVCNFLFQLNIKKDDPMESKAENVPFSETIKYTLGNKNFRNVIIMTILFNTARQFTAGFIGVYKTNDLMMSVFLIQLVNIVANAARALVSRPIAKYADNTSYAKGMTLGLLLDVIGYFALMFTTDKNWWLIIVYTVFINCGLAGTNQNSYNITYSYVESRYFSQAMAIKNCIGGIFGFGASILGGMVLKYVQANNNMVFGLHIYGQQLMAGISLVLIIVTIVFLVKVIGKQTVIKQ